MLASLSAQDQQTQDAAAIQRAPRLIQYVATLHKRASDRVQVMERAERAGVRVSAAEREAIRMAMVKADAILPSITVARNRLTNAIRQARDAGKISGRDADTLLASGIFNNSVPLSKFVVNDRDFDTLEREFFDSPAVGVLPVLLIPLIVIAVALGAAVFMYGYGQYESTVLESIAEQRRIDEAAERNGAEVDRRWKLALQETPGGGVVYRPEFDPGTGPDVLLANRDQTEDKAKPPIDVTTLGVVAGVVVLGLFAIKSAFGSKAS